MAVMYEQLLPTGQHIADFPSLKGWQVVEEGQQKFAGSPWPHAVEFDAQVDSALSRRFSICSACEAAEKAVAEGTEAEMRQSAVSLSSIDRPILTVNCMKQEVKGRHAVQ